MALKLTTALTRKKTFADDVSETKLNRVLNLLDLTALGVGSTLGLGVYILAGSVAKSVAGPAVCISFLVAAIASSVSGLCYAEFAARVPKAGSAYVYSYVSVGEFVAYVIGWNLILEYVIGTASVARGLSNYIDALCDHEISKSLRDWMPMNVSFFSPFPDFLSFAFVILLAVLLAVGVKESTRLNNIFTLLNLLTIAMVLVSGSIKANVKNWNISKKDIDEAYRTDAGDGGFMPFGISGVMAGAAKCFYGFVGFDAVATTGEEAKNPQRNIPLSIVISLLIIFCAYFGISTVLTMMWPYYLQDKDAPFPHVYDAVGWPAIGKIVTVGAVFALFTSLLGAMFPLPRVIYAMASDGLVFKVFSTIHPWTKTPLAATILSGLFAGAMAALFDLDQLIDMMSIGTLMAYTIVAICVLILRYEPLDKSLVPTVKIEGSENIFTKGVIIMKRTFNLNMIKEPNTTTSKIVNWSIIIYGFFTALFCAAIIYGLDEIDAADKVAYPLYFVAIGLLFIFMLTVITVIARQPTNDMKLSFRVPWVPFIPCLSVFFNLYLMLELDIFTWIRFAVWLVIGLIIYGFYGIKNSEEGAKTKLTQRKNSYSKKTSL